MAFDKEDEFEERIKAACNHTTEEFGIEHIETSFREEFENLQKAHDAIHEFMLLAPILVPSLVDDGPGWQGKSAFLLYQSQVFDHAHRSMLEALCTYYNVAFILLRATFELMIKGAFWECLSHKMFRDNSQVLDNNSQGRKIKKWLNDIIKVASNVEKGLEQNSAGIYDKIEPIVEDRKFRPSIRVIIRQLDQWGMFNPITEVETQIYQGIYGRLSADVHVIPDRTDIGRRLIAESSELFKQELLPDILRQYAESLHEVMDLAIVIELNILGDFIKEYDEVQENLRGRLTAFEQLGLEYSLKKVKLLLG